MNELNVSGNGESSSFPQISADVSKVGGTVSAGWVGWCWGGWGGGWRTLLWWITVRLFIRLPHRHQRRANWHCWCDSRGQQSRVIGCYFRSRRCALCPRLDKWANRKRSPGTDPFNGSHLLWISSTLPQPSYSKVFSYSVLFRSNNSKQTFSFVSFKLCNVINIESPLHIKWYN